MGGSSERIWVKKLCVGAFDDFCQRTLLRREKDSANNQTAYFSGHYEHYCVNCLGTCDVEGISLFFFVSHHQEKQMMRCHLSTLDVTKFWEICQPVHTLSVMQHLNFPKISLRHSQAQRQQIYWMILFNLFLNQARIRIEISFARLSNKFRLSSMFNFVIAWNNARTRYR